MNLRRTVVSLAVLGLAIVAAGPSTPSLAADRAPALTNLAHLDWLCDTVDPPQQEGHTTYRLAAEPELGVLWTYAEPRNGVLTRVGGGTYDPATDPTGRAPSTPTTSRGRRSSTSGTGSRAARERAATRRTSCCAA